MTAQFGLRCSFPFQEFRARQGQSDEGANDRVDIHERLIRQQSQREENLHVSVYASPDRLAPKAAPFPSDAMPENGEKELQVRWHHQQDQGGRGPRQRTVRQKEPATNEEPERGDVAEAPAQIIQDLPASNQGQRIGHPVAHVVWNPREQPPYDLPITPDPAMLPATIGAKMGGTIVNQFNIRDKTGAGIVAFDQVMTEQRITGKSLCQDLLKDLHFINPLPGVAPLTKQVLVHIR